MKTMVMLTLLFLFSSQPNWAQCFITGPFPPNAVDANFKWLEKNGITEVYVRYFDSGLPSHLNGSTVESHIAVALLNWNLAGACFAFGGEPPSANTLGVATVTWEPFPEPDTPPAYAHTYYEVAGFPPELIFSTTYLDPAWVFFGAQMVHTLMSKA